MVYRQKAQLLVQSLAYRAITLHARVHCVIEGNTQENGNKTALSLDKLGQNNKTADT